MKDVIVVTDKEYKIIINQYSYYELVKWLIVEYAGVSYEEASICISRHRDYFESIDTVSDALLEEHDWPYYYLAMTLYFGDSTNAKPVKIPPDTPEGRKIYKEIEDRILLEHNLKEPFILYPIMDIGELQIWYEKTLQPVFGEQLRVEEDGNYAAIILDGVQEDFYFSLYGTDCVHLYWCNQCFIFDKGRNLLTSSDTYGEIVFEGELDIERLPQMIVDLVLQLKDCTYVSKKEVIRGKIPSGYDSIRDYVIKAKTDDLSKTKYQLSNIRIEYIV